MVMAIKWISSAWQSNLATVFSQDRRMYVDFRQQFYPPIAGTPTFTLIADTDNQPGSHNLTGGYADYLLDLPSTMILDAYFKPTFAFNVATDQVLFAWYNDATHYLKFYYVAATDNYILEWYDGTTARQLVSSAYTDTPTLQVWTRATFSLDLTTGTTAGSAFYLAGAVVDSTWSGNSDVKARNFPKFSLRHLSGTAGAYTINYLRIFPSVTATAAEVTANFSAKKNEEIVWHLNGHATGHTRCNITSRIQTCDIERTVESPAGTANPNSCTLSLLSPIGQFADDQYSAFNSTGEIYNGTSDQKYMQTRCGVEVETYYGGLYELEFAGRTDDNMFHRSSVFDGVTRVTVTAFDGIEDMRRRVRQKYYAYENYAICDPTTEASSILHNVARMESQKEWYNFLANAAFSSTAPQSSWLSTQLARTTDGIFGDYRGTLTPSSSGCIMAQTVTFSGDKKLDVGQNWNVSLYISSTASCTGGLVVGGDSLGWTCTGGAGWAKIERTHAISSSSEASLVCTLTGASTGAIVNVSKAMLIQNNRSPNWFVPNTSTGAAGSIGADSAMSTTFETMGFDVDDNSVIHPWALVRAQTPIWDTLTEIGDASAARYIGMDACGTFKYRTPFKASTSDPTPGTTITSLMSVDSMIDVAQSNKLVVHGVKIVKDNYMRTLWTAKDCDSFDKTQGGSLYETVANGAVWPPTTDFGEFWANYDDKGPVALVSFWNRLTGK
jgi:hypothetical protein